MTDRCQRRRKGVLHRIVSLAEASRLTGLPKSAIKARIERGELRSVKRAGLRRISVDELAERRLVGPSGFDLEPPDTSMVDRLERQAEEIGHLRLELAIVKRKLELERERRELRDVRDRRRP